MKEGGRRDATIGRPDNTNSKCTEDVRDCGPARLHAAWCGGLFHLVRFGYSRRIFWLLDLVDEPCTVFIFEELCRLNLGEKLRLVVFEAHDLEIDCRVETTVNAAVSVLATIDEIIRLGLRHRESPNQIKVGEVDSRICSASRNSSNTVATVYQCQCGRSLIDVERLLLEIVGSDVIVVRKRILLRVRLA